MIESSFGNDDEDLLKLEEYTKQSLQNASNAPANQMLNFTFEAQVSVRCQLCKFLFFFCSLRELVSPFFNPLFVTVEGLIPSYFNSEIEPLVLDHYCAHLYHRQSTWVI